MFIINVIVETESGIKLLRTIVKAAPLPTETWLGNIKKNTAAATMAVPTVIIANSLIVLQNFMSFSSFVFEVILHYTSFSGKVHIFFKTEVNQIFSSSLYARRAPSVSCKSTFFANTLPS